MSLTGEEANALSMRRAATLRTRLYLLAGFVLMALLMFSIALQRQQDGLSNYVHQMCLERAVGVEQTNKNWEGLAKIERHNKFIDQQIRNERLTLYEHAKLKQPDCTN